MSTRRLWLAFGALVIACSDTDPELIGSIADCTTGAFFAACAGEAPPTLACSAAEGECLPRVEAPPKLTVPAAHRRD